MRLIEIRLLDGPNLYRLEPAVKVEVAIGRRRSWYGDRAPARHALVRLGAHVPPRSWPDDVARIVAWARWLRSRHDEGAGGVAVHRSSDPGHWIVTFPWQGAERAMALTEAALALAERDVSAARGARLTGAQERLLSRWNERIEAARSTPPEWVRDVDRHIPIVSVSGTNGKSTVTRLMTHILLRAGRRVGTTTSDGVLIDERMIEPGDWTGPGGARQILARRDIDVAVLFAEAYADEPFVEVAEVPPGVRDVRETNVCRIWATRDERTGRAIVFAALDNLWKGTSSQAVQSLNLMLGFDEDEGLR